MCVVQPIDASSGLNVQSNSNFPASPRSDIRSPPEAQLYSPIELNAITTFHVADGEILSIVNIHQIELKLAHLAVLLLLPGNDHSILPQIIYPFRVTQPRRRLAASLQLQSCFLHHQKVEHSSKFVSTSSHLTNLHNHSNHQPQHDIPARYSYQFPETCPAHHPIW